MQQDFLLIWKMKNGDEATMDGFVKKYYPRILQYCLYHCPDRNEAQDLTQETFERFFKNLADYRHIGKDLNYLYTIARNLCIDWSRQQKPDDKNDNYVDFFGTKENDIQKKTDNGDEGTDKIIRKLMIEEALQKLPDELREIVILHYFQELSLREVSVVLQISLPLVKYRMKKAKEELRKILI